MGPSRLLAPLRWVFLPVGLFSLVAVGIHAAADPLSVQLLGLADRFAALADHALARFDLTSPLVGWLSPGRCTSLARGLALALELAADAVLALPLLNHAERDEPGGRWRDTLRRWALRPAVLRLTRPLAAIALSLAGACSVARMVEGEVFQASEAPQLARFVAVLVLGGVALTLGSRATLETLRWADVKTQEVGARAGLLGTLILTPLVVSALRGAAPILSFFR